MHRFAILRGAAALAIATGATFAHAGEVPLEVAFADGFEPATPNVFRLGSLALRDPHVFYSIVICLDITDQLNAQLQDSLDADSDGDGFYDFSPLAVMRPHADDGLPHPFETRDGVCTIAEPVQCEPGVEPPVSRWYASFDVTPPTVCLGPLPNTTSGYSPPVPSPGGHCFTSTAVDSSLPFGEVAIPLWDTLLASPWPAADGSTGGGLMRGFLRESDADQIVVDVSGQSVVLSSVLPGGTGSCAQNVAHGKDTDRDESGWWMYLETRLDAVSGNGF